MLIFRRLSLRSGSERDEVLTQKKGWLNLAGADLRGAYLEEAHLEGASLVSAHLEAADLVGAHLEEAVLDGSYLNGAFLYNAHLDGARLIGCRGLKPDQAWSVYWDQKTRWPEDLGPLRSLAAPIQRLRGSRSHAAKRSS